MHIESQHLHEHGWEIITNPFSADELQQLRNVVTELSQRPTEAVRARGESLYAARNLLSLCPELITQWQAPQLVEFIKTTLGPQAGLVRGLFFDKPPNQTWALPWHKDVLIATQDVQQREGYSKPRLRAGVPHTEPPLSVLENMLTLRIHLDEVTAANGPLEVLSGSHTTGKELVLTGFEQQSIHANAGDTLAMRPLLVHSSGRSDPECLQHRQIIHLEYAADPKLPQGAQWHQFHTF